MGAASESHLDLLWLDADGGGAAHEALEQLARALPLVPAPDAPRQQAVQRAGHHRELQVGVDLQRHLGTQRVRVEEVNRLGDGILDHHAPGVAVDQVRGPGLQLVGEQQGGPLAAQVGDGQLADGDGVAAQLDGLVKDPRMAVLAPDVVQGDAFPALAGEQLAHHLGGAAAQGQEADAELLQAGQHGVGGEAGVEHQLAGQPAAALPVGVDEAQHGLVPVLLAHGGVDEAERVLAGVAHEEGEHAALAAAALGDAVLLQEGLAAMAGDGMEVEVEGGAGGHAEAVDGIEPGAGPWGDEARVDAAGVLAEGGALGDGVEAGEQAEAGVEGVGRDAGGAADAPQLEGEHGEGGADGGDGAGAGQAAAPDEGVEAQLGEEGQEEEQAAESGAEGARGEVKGLDGGEGSGEGLERALDLASGAAREAGQAGSAQDLGDVGDGGGQAFVAQQVADLIGGEVLRAESEDALAELAAGVVGRALGGGLAGREEEGALGVAAEGGEQIAQRAGGVAEALGCLLEGELVDTQGAEGFVLAVVGVGGPQEMVGQRMHKKRVLIYRLLRC